MLALVLARLVSDPVWTFYLSWIPEYLKRERGFSLTDIGLYAWIPFVAGAIGGMTGGRASDILIARGMGPVKGRSWILYISTAMAPLGMLTTRVHSAAAAILLIAVMAFVFRMSRLKAWWVRCLDSWGPREAREALCSRH